MAWSDVRRAAREKVFQTFQYPAVLHLEGGGTLPVDVKWHRRQTEIGEDQAGWLATVSDSDRLVFHSDQPGVNDLVIGQRVVVTDDNGSEVEFLISNIEPPDYPTVACDVANA